MTLENGKKKLKLCYDYIIDAFKNDDSDQIETARSIVIDCLRKIDIIDEETMSDVMVLLLEYRLFYSKLKLREIYIDLLNNKKTDKDIQELLELLIKRYSKKDYNYEEKIFMDKIFDCCNEILS